MGVKERESDRDGGEGGRWRRQERKKGDWVEVGEDLGREKKREREREREKERESNNQRWLYLWPHLESSCIFK